MIYIFTNNEAAFKNIFPKNAHFLTLTSLSGHSPQSTDISYADITGFTSEDITKILAKLKKTCKNSAWGLINPNNNIKNTEESSFLKTGVKLPAASAFPGWKKITTGKTMPFYLLYCSLQGKTSLDSRLEEKALAQVHKRFLGLLNMSFKEGEGLLWMDSGKDCLFLLPPKAKNVQSIIEACIRMIISAPLITLETLAISVPVNFVFALHYGSVSYKPPGKTGTVVNDSVNAIFHLGAKKAESGRLTVSGEIPDGSIPKSLEDWFIPAGVYEGRKIWHTKKFSYEKSWE